MALFNADHPPAEEPKRRSQDPYSERLKADREVRSELDDEVQAENDMIRSSHQITKMMDTMKSDLVRLEWDEHMASMASVQMMTVMMASQGGKFLS